mmetsp:Transcript_36079/g.90751  ORF Transcript_36079/g.90751 Transcript_36079/m.90751 type:complete len:204 (+) Transcript_36079:130-741(+)
MGMAPLQMGGATGWGRAKTSPEGEAAEENRQDGKAAACPVVWTTTPGEALHASRRLASWADCDRATQGGAQLAEALDSNGAPSGAAAPPAVPAALPSEGCETRRGTGGSQLVHRLSVPSEAAVLCKLSERGGAVGAACCATRKRNGAASLTASFLAGGAQLCVARKGMACEATTLPCGCVACAEPMAARSFSQPASCLRATML